MRLPQRHLINKKYTRQWRFSTALFFFHRPDVYYCVEKSKKSVCRLQISEVDFIFFFIFGFGIVDLADDVTVFIIGMG